MNRIHTLLPPLVSALALIAAAAGPIALADDAPYALTGWQQLGTRSLSDNGATPLAAGTLVRSRATDGAWDVIEAFDVDQRAWVSLPPPPEGRSQPMVAAWGDTVLLFGGVEVGSGAHADDTWMFNGQRGTWTVLSEMPEPRAGGAVVVVDDLFYLVGGTGGSNRVLRYDPTQDAWRRLSELDGVREFPAAVAIEGRIYVIGGRDENGGDLASTLAYDIAADRFEPAPSLLQARSLHAAVVYDGRVVALGGEPKSGTHRLTSIESWQPGEPAWQGAGNLPGELTAIAAASARGRLYVMGDSLRPASRQPAPVLVSARHGPATPASPEVQ